MTPGTKRLIWPTTIAVAATGALYAAFAYFMTPADPMDLDNHPWQAPTLQAHVIAAPIWMFAFGVVWQSHVLAKLRSARRERRRTGIALLALALPMVASGYLLQTSTSEWWREAWIVVHVGVSVLWLLVLIGHCLVRVPRGAG